VLLLLDTGCHPSLVSLWRGATEATSCVRVLIWAFQDGLILLT
jgi:hypothetical protein